MKRIKLEISLVATFHWETLDLDPFEHPTTEECDEEFKATERSQNISDFERVSVTRDWPDKTMTHGVLFGYTPLFLSETICGRFSGSKNISMSVSGEPTQEEHLQAWLPYEVRHSLHV